MKTQPNEELWQACEREGLMLARAFERRMAEIDAPLHEALSVMGMMVARICAGSASHNITQANKLFRTLQAGMSIALPALSNGEQER